jgi:hypothetical protein
MDGMIVRFEEVGFLKMVGWDRQSWKKPRLVVAVAVAAAAAAAAAVNCSYDKRTKHHKAVTSMPHVANK